MLVVYTQEVAAGYLNLAPLGEAEIVKSRVESYRSFSSNIVVECVIPVLCMSVCVQ